MASPTFVTFDEIDPQKIRCLNYVSKQIPVPPGQQAGSAGSYCELPIQYNYGTEEEPHIDDLRIELPLVTSNGGITYSQQNGKTNIQVPISLPRGAGSETEVYVEKMNQVWLTLAYYLYQVRKNVKFESFMIYAPGDEKKPDPQINPLMVENTKFKNPVYYPKDNGEPIAGRSATQYLRLFKRGTGPLQEKTLFTDLDGKAIAWELLQMVEVKMQPLIHLKKIYVGAGKASIQSEMISAVVVPPIVAKGTATRQLSSIEKLKARGYSASELTGQLSTLASNRQGSSTMAPGGQPTLLTPADPPSTGTMSSISEGNGAPATEPSASANSGLQSMLAGPNKPNAPKTPGGFNLPSATTKF